MTINSQGSGLCCEFRVILMKKTHLIHKFTIRIELWCQNLQFHREISVAREKNKSANLFSLPHTLSFDEFSIQFSSYKCLILPRKKLRIYQIICCSLSYFQLKTYILIFLVKDEVFFAKTEQFGH